jgi:hypothetical protein
LTGKPEVTFSRFQADPDDVVQKSAWGKLNRLTQKFGNIVPGVFKPVLAKHSKSFSLIALHCSGSGSNAEKLRADAKAGRNVAEGELTDVTAKVVR